MLDKLTGCLLELGPVLSGLPIPQALAMAAGAMLLGSLITYGLDKWLKNEPGPDPRICHCGEATNFFVNGLGFCSWDCVPAEWRANDK